MHRTDPVLSQNMQLRKAPPFNADMNNFEKVRVHFQKRYCGIWGGETDTGAGFSAKYFRFPLPVSFHQCTILIWDIHVILRKYICFHDSQTVNINETGLMVTQRLLHRSLKTAKMTQTLTYIKQIKCRWCYPTQCAKFPT